MSILKKSICIILAIVMCFGSAVAMYAEEKSKVYISDIKIGYGAEGKQKLIDAGYKVDNTFNVNSNGRGSLSDTSVWIGFKETDNALDAITDIAVMNMNGEYTFSGWAEELQSLQAQIDAMYEDFAIGIEEYKENYKAGSPYAKAACDLMNYFIDTGYTNKRIGDLFRGDSVTEADIKNIFIMGNYQFIKTIKQCVAIACTEWKQNEDGSYDTFVQRLNKNGYCTDEPDPSYNHERELISEAIANLKPDIEEAEINREKYYNTYSLNKEAYKLDEKDIPAACTDEELDQLQFENYIMKQCTEGQQQSYFYYENIIYILKNITIKPEKKNKLTGKITQARESLYDIVKKDATALKESDFETIRKSMTAGQIGVVNTVGLPLLLTYEASVQRGSFDQDFAKCKEKYEEDYDAEVISVYYGVDLSVFTDVENTALTSDAHTAVKGIGNGTFGLDTSADTELFLGIPDFVNCILLASGFFGLIYGGLSLYKALTATVPKVVESAFSAVTYNTISVPAVSASAVGLSIFIIAVSIAAVTISIIAMVQNEKKKNPPEQQDITYTKIPHAIVDVDSDKDAGVAEQKIYYTYSCAELIDANKSSTNSLDIYGDLNQHNKKDQWVAVYYTKNRDCGYPITSSVVLQESSQAPTGYMAIHDFETSAASDLNMYNSGSDKKSIYGFVKTTTFTKDNDGNQTSSVFGTGSTVMLAVLTFVAGAAVSGVVTYSGTKKKYKKA